MRVLVLGLGNILLRDEGVGVRVIEALAGRYVIPAEVEILDGGTSGMDLLDTIAGREHLLICDAVRSDAPPTSVMKLTNAQVPAMFRNRFSPHQLGLADVLATLTLTDEAPDSVTLIGIVPSDLELGMELSPEVAEAAEKAVEWLAAELRGLGFVLELRFPSLDKEGCPEGTGWLDGRNEPPRRYAPPLLSQGGEYRRMTMPLF